MAPEVRSLVLLLLLAVVWEPSAQRGTEGQINPEVRHAHRCSGKRDMSECLNLCFKSRQIKCSTQAVKEFGQQYHMIEGRI